MDLRGASAGALSELTGRLTSSLSSTSSAEQVGEELFTVSQLMRNEPGLRRFATDAALPPEAKQGMVAAVFADRVSEPVQDLLSEAVGRRWTSARDLPDALERLSEIAIVTSAGEKSSVLTDELFSFNQVVNGDPELRDALSDPGRSVEDKSRLLDALLTDSAQPATLTLAKHALSGTYRTFNGAMIAYREVAAAAQGQTVATVRVARPLADDDRQRLVDALSRQYDAEVHLNEVVDPSVLGGISVEIGDQFIDGTMSSRLNEARRRLAG